MSKNNYSDSLDGAGSKSSCSKGCCGGCGKNKLASKGLELSVSEGPVDYRIRTTKRVVADNGNSKGPGAVFNGAENGDMLMGAVEGSPSVSGKKIREGKSAVLPVPEITVTGDPDGRRVFWYCFVESVRSEPISTRASHLRKMGFVIVRPKGIVDTFTSDRSFSSYKATDVALDNSPGKCVGTEGRTTARSCCNEAPSKLQDTCPEASHRGLLRTDTGCKQGVAYRMQGSELADCERIAARKVNPKSISECVRQYMTDKVVGILRPGLLRLQQRMKADACVVRRVGVAIAVAHTVADLGLLALGTFAVVGAGAAIAEKNAKTEGERKEPGRSSCSTAKPVVFRNGCSEGMRHDRCQNVATSQKSVSCVGDSCISNKMEKDEPSGVIQIGSIVRFGSGLVLGSSVRASVAR